MEVMIIMAKSRPPSLPVRAQTAAVRSDKARHDKSRLVEMNRCKGKAGLKKNYIY